MGSQLPCYSLPITSHSPPTRLPIADRRVRAHRVAAAAAKLGPDKPHARRRPHPRVARALHQPAQRLGAGHLGHPPATRHSAGTSPSERLPSPSEPFRALPSPSEPFRALLSPYLHHGAAQPLWFGFDVPEDAAAGEYTLRVRVTELDEGSNEETSVSVRVASERIEQHGDSELWRHTRLRWLDSTAGDGVVDVAAVAKSLKARSPSVPSTGFSSSVGPPLLILPRPPSSIFTPRRPFSSSPCIGLLAAQANPLAAQQIASRGRADVWQPVTVDRKALVLTASGARVVRLSRRGLPASLRVGNVELLAAPMQLHLKSKGSAKLLRWAPN